MSKDANPVAEQACAAKVAWGRGMMEEVQAEARDSDTRKGVGACMIVIRIWPRSSMTGAVGQ